MTLANMNEEPIYNNTDSWLGTENTVVAIGELSNDAT